MPSALLQIDKLSLATETGFIVQDLSFTISKGEIVALTGPSGQGKTSIAMAILGLLPPGIKHQSGTITWTTEDQQLSLPEQASSWKALRGMHIGFTQQDVYSAFDPVIKMGRQMMWVVKERLHYPDTKIEAELRSKLMEVGIDDMDRIWNSFPHELSGGQLQRCQLCMAMVIKPELLITDEPTSAIDNINQQELLEVLANLRNHYGMSILCITHQASVVKILADREIHIGKSEQPNNQIQLHNEQLNSKMNEPLLGLEKVMQVYRYGGLFNKSGAIIGPVSFILHKGECIGIIGESGSGKSTLAQIMVGMLDPSSGSIMLNGEAIDLKRSTDVNKLRAHVQLVMQDGRGSLHPNFTIKEILEEVAAFKKKSNPLYEFNLSRAMEEVNLSPALLGRKPGTLSGGECLRVSIARALLMEPVVLICDESTSALDEVAREGIKELLNRIMLVKSLGLILISHDESMIRSMANQILVVADGKVIEQGDARDIIQNPVHGVTQKIFEMKETSRKNSRPSP